MTTAYEFQFWLFAVLAIVSALAFVTRRNPVPAALWLVNVMFALAGLYVLFDAPFVGAVQVLVYAGAIMVVFIFVVMLLNLGRDGLSDLRPLAARLSAGLVAAGLLATLLTVARDPLPAPALAPPRTTSWHRSPMRSSPITWWPSSSRASCCWSP